MQYTIDYRPTPKQMLFHQSTAKELLYGGAAGGGKSKACVMDAFVFALKHPGTCTYMFRRSYPELRDTLIAEALRSIPHGLGHYVASTHDYLLPNGSQIRFRHCNTAKDVYLYQGAEMHRLYIDELTHFVRDTYDYLKTRVRAPKGLGIVPAIRCTSNPGGPGHAWVKEYFVDSGVPGEMHEDRRFVDVLGREMSTTIQYIPALALDNPHISREYLVELDRKPPKLRDALLYGKWDAFEGQVFTEFMDNPDGYVSRVGTHVIAPFEIPPHWKRYRSLDWGYTRPFSVGWWAVDGEGVVYRYREWYGGVCGQPNVGLKMTPREVAREIRRIEREAHESNVQGIADPAIFATSDGGDSVAEQMEREKVLFRPGQHDHWAGKMQLHYRLQFDERRMPRMYIFNTCRDWIRTIPTLSYDPAKVEDVDTDGEDHCYDETRYFLMERPMPSREPKSERIYIPI
jgi:hypothetical protein